MFFILSKILVFLIKPFYQILLILIASFLLKKKIWKKRLHILAVFWFLIFTNGFLYDTCMRSWEIPAIPISSLPDSCEYAIVLGGTEDTKRNPNDRLFFHKGAERITHALNLYKAGKVKKILFSGGNSDLFEGAYKNNNPVLDFYLMCGVDREDIIIESTARNTYENAKLTSEILRKKGAQGPYILITSAFHMRRSEACFRSAGLEVIPFSADFYATIKEDRYNFGAFLPSAIPLVNWEILIKEWIGYLAYDITGKI
ncbi:MAG TPA: hypothetical protein DDY13_00605 [Cytophagales bacterium]|jgi:uncharacterized SAM-binding protein YcdF (DUF218 family)|nr:hypothetical protein [Cytophagales bacterium]